MVRTVARNSVEKCPDSGATSSTRGCAVAISFLKCRSVPNGVVGRGLFAHLDLAIADLDRIDAERRTGMGEAGPRDQFIDRGEIAHGRMVRRPTARRPNLAAMLAQAADRHHDVGSAADRRDIASVLHGRRRPPLAGPSIPRLQTRLVHFLLRCDKNMNILHTSGRVG